MKIGKLVTKFCHFALGGLVIKPHRLVITLRAKLRGAVYCNRSCL